MSPQYTRVQTDYSQYQRVELAMHTSNTFRSPNWLQFTQWCFPLNLAHYG